MTPLKVSVIIPCYNGEEYLEECLDSIINQDYSSLEIIFVDNESTDASLDIARKTLDCPDVIISSAENIYEHTWNEAVEEGMRLMSGDYFTIVAVDDVITTDYVSNVVSSLNSQGELPMCFQSPILVPGPNRVVGYTYEGMEDFKNQMLVHCAVNTPTVFYSRKLYEEGHMSYKSEKYLGASDYDLYCQLADKDILIHPGKKWLGYWYRLHDKGCSCGMVKASQDGGNYDQRIKEYWTEKWKS